MVGKTNMDQFAAGLVGTRTPYGVPRNAFDPRFVPGGSSSGSGALVGGGLLPFALGTDTAGSGERRFACCWPGHPLRSGNEADLRPPCNKLPILCHMTGDVQLQLL
jgi:Amidase